MKCPKTCAVPLYRTLRERVRNLGLNSGVHRNIKKATIGAIRILPRGRNRYREQPQPHIAR